MHRVGEEHGAEGERVWANGGEEYGGDIWVNEGSASGEGVSSGAGRGGEDAAVGLDDG